MTNQSTLTKIRNANALAAMKTTTTTIATHTVGRATITWGILGDKRTPEQIAARNAQVDAEMAGRYRQHVAAARARQQRT